jgi:transposase
MDLAKLVFQVHGVDARAKITLREQLKRSQVAEFFAQLAPCLIAMEARGGAHFWARKLHGFCAPREAHRAVTTAEALRLIDTE